jgi:hypothetical protein
MPLLSRRRKRSTLPLHVTEPEAASKEHNGAHRINRRRWRPLVLLRKHCVTISLLLILVILFLRKNLVWIYKNRYLYLNCPEVAFWLRQPNFGTTKQPPHILYLTAKFGPTNGTFARAIHQQVQGVKRLNVLPAASSEIISYTNLPQEFVNDPRWKQHVDSLYGRIPRQPFPGRGGGYWFWKPLLLQRHLSQLQDGDFLIYSDSDMLDFFSWLALLLETMVEEQANLALYQLPYLEQEWTKRDVYEHYCPFLLCNHVYICKSKNGTAVTLSSGSHQQWLQDKS